MTVQNVGRAGASLLAAAAILTLGATGAHAAPGTTLTVDVTGCSDCSLKPTRSLSPGDVGSLWSGPTRKVENGQVSFVLPKNRTKGLAFEITSPSSTNPWYTTNVVFRYANKAAGSRVSPDQAAAGKRAFGCWAGTRARRAHLSFTVDWFSEADSTLGGTYRYMRAYANPGTKTFGHAMRTNNGTLGNQNVFSCRK